MHEITMQDINGYLATKGENEIVGNCMDGNSCLAHNVLVWKYSLENDDVLALCTYAMTVGGGTVDFPQDVERAVRVFDNLKEPNSPVTKAEFIAALGGNQ